MNPVSQELYPFTGQYLEVNGLDNKPVRLHYLDEGEKTNDPIVMVHGNPTWSFYYRRLVTALSPSYRTVVPDHVGCGLSDKPGDERYPYTLERRIADLDTLINHLDLGDRITLIVHDWGGMIGLGWAAQNVERVARLVILNTGAFPLPPSKPFPWQLALTRTPFGALAVRGFNAFSGVASRVCVVQPMPAEIRRAYRAPYNSWKNRIATLRFVQDIPLRPADPGYDIVTSTERELPRFDTIPVMLCWGEKDFVFDAPFRERFEELLPNATVHSFPDAGHYVLEDKADEIEALVTRFLAEDTL